MMPQSLRSVAILAYTATVALWAGAPVRAQTYDIVATEIVRAKLRDPRWIVVDVRDSNTFIGWPRNGEQRGGHIPGAANVAVAWVQENLDGVRGLLESKGILGDKQVILYGVDSSQAERMADLLVNKHAVDASRLHLYADGFLAWSAQTELPVERLPKYDHLVPPIWLAEQLKVRPELLVFEVSWRERDNYERRHIPGALYLDTDLLEVGPIWNIVPPDRLGEALTSLGIAHDVPVVLYGHDTTASARAAVVMLYAGVNDVRLLNGGFAAWERAGLPAEAGWVPPIPVKEFGTTIPVHPEYITGLDHARGLLADPNGELVSIRSWEEFIGSKSGYPTIRATGRIKGAVWGHSGTDSGMADFRNPDNTMRDYGDIVRFWADWGITPERRLGFYCGTGWRASEAFFAAWLMGWDNITVYDGGWFEWSEDPSNPVAAGDPRRAEPGLKPIVASPRWETLFAARFVLPLVLLVVLGTWETVHPFLGERSGRLRHGVYNLAMALFNAVLLTAGFSLVTLVVTDWTTRNQLGLLHLTGLSTMVRFLLALVLIDAWMYVWHRLNHRIPLLWRFHRMHHSDPRVDVTTATRFHLGEHAAAVLLLAAMIPLIGFEIWHIITYDLILIAVTQFHHADISFGRCDRWIRWLVVTPDMHKVHHSRYEPETNSNYASVLSLWDRLAGTLRMRPRPQTIEFGLDRFDGPQWHTFSGMLKTPFVTSCVVRGGGDS